MGLGGCELSGRMGLEGTKTLVWGVELMGYRVVAVRQSDLAHKSYVYNRRGRELRYRIWAFY